MSTIYLSVAHVNFSRGATYGNNSEYLLSLQLTEEVAETLAEILGPDDQVVYHDVSDDEPENYDEALALKVIVANEEAPTIDDLAVEIHFNSLEAKGSCVIHNARSTRGKLAAEAVQRQVMKLGYGKCWHGVFPLPGKYRDITIDFLAQTKARAILIEPAGIKQISDLWNKQEKERLILHIANGLSRAL